MALLDQEPAQDGNQRRSAASHACKDHKGGVVVAHNIIDGNNDHQACRTDDAHNECEHGRSKSQLRALFHIIGHGSVHQIGIVEGCADIIQKVEDDDPNGNQHGRFRNRRGHGIQRDGTHCGKQNADQEEGLVLAVLANLGIIHDVGLDWVIYHIEDTHHQQNGSSQCGTPCTKTCVVCHVAHEHGGHEHRCHGADSGQRGCAENLGRAHVFRVLSFLYSFHNVAPLFDNIVGIKGWTALLRNLLQLKTAEVNGACAFEHEENGLCSGKLYGVPCLRASPLSGGRDRDLRDWISVEFGIHKQLSFSGPPNGHAYTNRMVKTEVFESCHTSICHVGNVLIRLFVSVLPGLGKVGMDPLFVLFKAAAVHKCTLPGVKVAGDPCIIFSAAQQGTVVQTAACGFHLGNGAIRLDEYLFRASLAGAFLLIGLAVVENIPLSIDFNHAAVGIAGVIVWFRPALIAYITDADQCSPVCKRPQG